MQTITSIKLLLVLPGVAAVVLVVQVFVSGRSERAGGSTYYYKLYLQVSYPLPHVCCPISCFFRSPLLVLIPGSDVIIITDPSHARTRAVEDPLPLAPVVVDPETLVVVFSCHRSR